MRLAGMAATLLLATRASALKLIGAGWPVGTVGLQAALDALGVHRCGTMERILQSPWSVAQWLRIADADEDDALRRELLREWVDAQGLDCTLGFPAALYYEDLMALYPQAPVLLSESDSNDQWWADASKTVLRFGELDDVRRVGFGVFHFMHFNPAGVAMKVLFRRTYLVVFDDMGVRHEAMSKDLYRSWVETVKKTVPKSRLVAYNVRQGWRPLAAALKRPEPSAPFPKVDELAEFKRKWDALGALGWATLVLYMAVIYRVLRYWVCASPLVNEADAAPGGGGGVKAD